MGKDPEAAETALKAENAEKSFRVALLFWGRFRFPLRHAETYKLYLGGADMLGGRDVFLRALVVGLMVLPACSKGEEGDAAPLSSGLVSPPSLKEVNQRLRVRTEAFGLITLAVTPSPPPEFGDYFGDDYTLSVYSDDGQISAEHPFQTSYGIFRVEVVDLDHDGIPEIILIEGSGRGTSVRSERLRVLALRGRAVRILETVPYSGYFGSGARWWYEHAYLDTDRDGRLEIRLMLHHTPIGQGGGECLEAIPGQSILTLDVK